MKPAHGRILVVDDDPAMLRAVERILAPRYEVRSFTSGEEALAAFRAAPSDVAVVDVRMPKMDGFELTRALRALQPRTEVILVTGSITDLDEKMIRAIEERAFYFITKPFSKAVLTSLVAWCLEMQRLAEERDELIRRLTDDLERARRFQRALVPQNLPRAVGPVRAAAAWVSCEAVGGDLFDIVPLGPDRVLLAVADVAGHGVAAALLTGMVKTAVGRSLQERVDLGAAARAITELLAPLRQSRVVTLFLALVERGAGSLQYLNAGHPPAVISRPGAAPRLLPATTPLLAYGLEVGPEPVASAAFGPGDRLAIYSDGLYEIRDPAGAELGRERVVRLLSEHPGPIEATVEAAMEATRKHAAGRPPEDDLTLLIAERSG